MNAISKKMYPRAKIYVMHVGDLPWDIKPWEKVKFKSLKYKVVFQCSITQLIRFFIF